MIENLMQLAADPVVWLALGTLIIMEIVLGIDNLIFIAILTNKLPEEQRPFARRLGIGGALILRLALLGTIAWIVKLTAPVFSLMDHAFSWRDLILIGGGLFLVWKATKEIHHHVDPDPDSALNASSTEAATVGFGAIIVQILLLDMVFSIDSILTAVGMTEHVAIMVIAVIVAVIVMMIAATPLSNFVNENPTVVMLALGFLLMIGMILIAEGFGAHVPKGYVYAAMAFSAFVEALNLFAKRRRLKKKEQ
jgi:predicted tellurium resistance membrane protein TerC